MEEISEIQNKIYMIRGVRVMLDFDLAELYQVETRVLKQAVRRNLERFPEDFMLKISESEANELLFSGVSQIVTPPGYNTGGHGVFAFTEQGVAMLSSVLRSETAILVNRNIIRTFVAMRNYIMSTQHLESELQILKSKIELLERNDNDNLEAINDLSEDIRKEIDDIYIAIAALSVKPTEAAAKPYKKIGFK